VAGGIIAGRAGEVVQAFEAAGLTVTDTRDDGEWVALRLEAPR
jgi:ribosomal protein L11 methylase PrmA